MAENVHLQGNTRLARAVVCVPTFRRPGHLDATLASIARQESAHAFAIAVVENDAGEKEGLHVACRFFERNPVAGLCLVEEQQGNCYAINAVFDAALRAFPAAEYFLMIDDDELAEPGWLDRMIEAADRTGSAIVGGPVYPDLAETGAAHLAAHPAFRPAYEKSGPVEVIYGSGNCLIARRVFATLAFPYFDVRFNYLGGGDTDFFVRARRSGWSFYWAADAVIRETVPASRTRFDWLMKRALRIGAINYEIERKFSSGLRSRIILAARNAAMLPISLAKSLRIVARGGRIEALHPIGIAVGRVLASLGIETQQYRAANLPTREG